MDQSPAVRGLGNPASDGAVIGPEALFIGKSTDARRYSWVVLYPDRIERTKLKKLTTVFDAKQDMTSIPTSAISTVTAKKDGLMSTKVTVRAGAEDIVFRFPHPFAEEFRDLLASLTVGVGSGPDADIPEQIGKLGELHATGVLSDDEFSAKKRDLLARM